jgi:hypothetical protein
VLANETGNFAFVGWVKVSGSYPINVEIGIENELIIDNTSSSVRITLHPKNVKLLI